MLDLENFLTDDANGPLLIYLSSVVLFLPEAPSILDCSTASLGDPAMK